MSVETPEAANIPGERAGGPRESLGDGAAGVGVADSRVRLGNDTAGVGVADGRVRLSNNAARVGVTNGRVGLGVGGRDGRVEGELNGRHG